MILRRIASAFRQQDWFTVAVEIMIVVLGVFLGLQVNNWNEARADRALEQEYLVRLYDDMNGSLQDYAANDGWDATRIESQELVLRALIAATDGDYLRADRVVSESIQQILLLRDKLAQILGIEPGEPAP